VTYSRSGVWQWVLAKQGLKVDQLAGLFASIQSPIGEHSNASRVIAAVFQPAKASYHDF
jgi:hypothetical protein